MNPSVDSKVVFDRRRHPSQSQFQRQRPATGQASDEVADADTHSMRSGASGSSSTRSFHSQRSNPSKPQMTKKKSNSSRSIKRSMTPPPPPRREFWGHNQHSQSRQQPPQQPQQQQQRRMIGDGSTHSAGNASVDSTGSTSTKNTNCTNPSSAGNSSRYKLYTSELEHMIANDAVKQVLKVMFASLAVVFQETQVERNGIIYTRIPSIPAAAARMMWSQLLGGVSISNWQEDNEETPGSGGGGGGHRTRIMKLTHEQSPDPSLADPVLLESFLKAVNSGENPIQKREKPKGFWNRKLNNNKKHEEKVDVELGDYKLRRRSKDPFLQFIRDALVETGFLELAGRQVDDDDEDDHDDDDNNHDESHDDEHSDMDITDDDAAEDAIDEDQESYESNLQGSTLDLAGWGNRKHRHRRESRTQYFQIYKDMQFQYGIYLSGLTVNEGGCAVPLSVDAHDTTTSGTDGLRERDTMRRWNDIMANACFKQLTEFCIIDTRATADTTNRNNSWMTSCNSCPFDDATKYAIQMYPSHLMRAGRVVEAARVLMNPKFFTSRLVSFQPFEAVSLHRQNMEEMDKRCSLAQKGHFDVGGDGNSMKPKEITLSAVKMIIKTIKEKFPIIGDNGTVHGPKVKGEKEQGEIGRSLHMIAVLLGDQGENKLSMETYELCLKYKVAALGPDHSSVGRTWRHMGHQHMNQYDYDDAIRAYSESIRIERLQDEVEYKHVILALNSMAMIYGMTRRPKKALDNYCQSLAIQKAQFGDTNLQVAETLNSMGIVYGMLCEFDSAIECYSESLYVKIRKFGKDHEDVADVYFNLGLCHNKRGDHEAAINAYQETLRIRKDLLGEEHEEVARVLHHIGVVLSEMEEIGDAQRFYEECLRIRRLVLGDEHEDVARTLHSLGLVYYEGGNYDMALECLEDAVELGRKKVGKRSEKVADSLHSMGMVYQKLANFKEANAKYEEALKIRRARLGLYHLDVATTLHNMGDVYYMMGDLEKSMETYEEAFEIRLKKLGRDHVDVAATRNNMGVVFMKKGEHNAAMECFSAALSVREEILGPDHEKCSDTLHNMGLVHKNLKQYAEAIERYDQALRVRKMQLGENDMKVADTLYNMAIVYANTGQYSNALERYKEALRTYRETGMSDDHPSVVNTLQWIKWGQKKLSKTAKRDL